MGQVTIYLDDQTEAFAKAAAQAAGVSHSKWIGTVIQEKAANDWPASIKALAGAWPDMPTAEELRRGDIPDHPREGL